MRGGGSNLARVIDPDPFRIHLGQMGRVHSNRVAAQVLAQQHIVSSDKFYRAMTCGNLSVIAKCFPDQNHISKGAGNPTQILHARMGVAYKRILAPQKILVGNISRTRCKSPSRIYLSAWAY
jgi:hypothetical protein